MNGARLLQQADLAGARGDRNTASASWRTANFVVGLNVRRGSERASGMGACAISWRLLRDEHPDTPGRDRVSGPFSNHERETSCSRTRKAGEVSKSSVGSRRRERLIREEIIGHRIRTGLGTGRGRMVCAGGGRTLALFHQPAREHRAGIFIKPLIEQRSNFLTKVGGRASRMILFRTYYLGLAPYDTARHFIGLSERRWLNWTEQIRQRCGEELLRRGMFPPRKYFSGGD